MSVTTDQAPDGGQGSGPVGGGTPLSSTVAYRVVTLLELVSGREAGTGVREAARLTGIDRSAVSRLLTQLEALGCVEQQADRGVYTAGPRLFSIAAAVRSRDSLWNAAKPIVAGVTARHNETCYLTARQGDFVVFRERVEARQTIRYVVELGVPFRLASGAAGRAILSALPGAEVSRILDDGLERFTDASITDPVAYRNQLEADRALGYAVSIGGWVPNGAGVASPYFDASGRCVGALTVSAPADRLSPAVVPEVGRTIRAASRELSRRLGHLGTWGPPEP